MDPLVEPPRHAVREAVALALAEDLTPLGDLTASLLPPYTPAVAQFVPREDGVVAGIACAVETFTQVHPDLVCGFSASDGDAIRAGQSIGEVRGYLPAILTAERTALNFLCQLSGVATITRRFVEAAASGGGASVWDTRKTVPGMRTLQKAAVRAGGGAPHRGNLSGWVMFKDNHLSVLGIAAGVTRAKDAWPGRMVQVECDDIDMMRDALAAGADAILLDNFSPEDAAEAVAEAKAWVAEHGGTMPLLECSGGITVETAPKYAATGVQMLSTSQITQSAPALDIGLDIASGASW